MSLCSSSGVCSASSVHRTAGRNHRHLHVPGAGRAYASAHMAEKRPDPGTWWPRQAQEQQQVRKILFKWSHCWCLAWVFYLGYGCYGCLFCWDWGFSRSDPETSVRIKFVHTHLMSGHFWDTVLNYCWNKTSLSVYWACNGFILHHTWEIRCFRKIAGYKRDIF